MSIFLIPCCCRYRPCTAAVSEVSDHLNDISVAAARKQNSKDELRIFLKENIYKALLNFNGKSCVIV